MNSFECLFNISLKKIPLYLMVVISLIGLPVFLHAEENLTDDFSLKQKEGLEEFERTQINSENATKNELKDFKNESELKYKSWQKNRKLEYQNFKNEIVKSWGEFIEPTNKRWVEYSKDRKSVSHVDFEKGTVHVEVLASNLTENNIAESMEQAIERVLTSKAVISPTPVQTGKELLNQPVLKNQVSDKNGKVITENNYLKFVEEVKKDIKIVETEGIKKAVVEFILVPDHLQKRMEPFLPIINQYCKKYSLNRSRVLATIEVESAFNPVAFSSAGAIGLMQLMPQYGGKEAYQFVLKTNDYPTERFLLNPENNIHLGCAYIYLLKNKYFKGINDPMSLLYCSIAAYNTGPGNTASAFTKSKNVAEAVKIINFKNNADWVFSNLLQSLPYKETRLYLREIENNMPKYR